MQYAFPDYYDRFKCIKDKCRHNCCIGWEIDIDDDTYEMYKGVEGKLGKKLFDSISCAGTPHFILDKNERCPFLNRNNLCELIIELGDDSLCQICSDHPRFRNFLPEREEMGIGMCCEAAAALILGNSAPVEVKVSGECVFEEEIILLRDRIISILQNRKKPILNRFDDALDSLGGSCFQIELNDWVDFFISLEKLDEKWTDILLLLKDKRSKECDGRFDEYMQGREYEYEQLAVYIIYRHMVNSSNLDDAVYCVMFAMLSVLLLYNLGMTLYYKKGSFSFEDQVELCRMFSSEIEYSDQNLNSIFDKISMEVFK